ncbi:MAG: VanW family protein [Patescibacteria group bacterium]
MIIKFKYPTFIAVILLLISFSVLAFLNSGRILPGIIASGQSIGGMSMEQAVNLLSEKAESHQKTPTNAILKAPDQKNRELTIAPADIGLKFDIEKTVTTAYSLSRKEKFPKNIIELMRISILGKKMELAVAIDRQKFDDYFRKNLLRYEKPAKNAAIIYDKPKDRFETEDGEQGVVIDQAGLKQKLLENGAVLATGNITILFQNDYPQTALEEAEQAKEKANSMLAQAPFLLRYNNSQTYQIERTQLKDLISFPIKDGEIIADLDNKELENLLMQIAPLVNIKPQNAILTMKDGKIVEFAISREGKELDIQKNIGAIKLGILEKNQKEIMLEASTLLPEIRTETIQNLGITALLATGESDFKGSSAARVHNVSLAAKKMNGILIKPNEEFSFVNAIGEIGPKEGYQAGLVIKGNKTVPEYGGGVCQVSTTMFRAATIAGLKITERYPHSLPVQYYNPQGFDATIYGPHPDLRFINDTGSNILVQTKTKGTKLYFEFYGTPDGREVKIIGPTEYDKKPDGSLKTTLIREIYKDGELASKDIFRSSYRSPVKEPAQRNPLE